MIYILNFALMLLCLIVLFALLWRTRRLDTIAWWAWRVLLVHSLICVTYIAYDAYLLGQHLPMELLLIRLGFVSLILGQLMLWQLLRHEHHRNHRLQTELNATPENATPENA